MAESSGPQEGVLKGKYVWGAKVGSYYKSVSIDGEVFSLGDCVRCLLKSKPGHIGKLWKFFEKDGKQMCRIRSFYAPSEIPPSVKGLDYVPKAKERFLASGEGPDVDQDMLLTGIVSRCNILCTAEEDLNRMPEDELVEAADHFFRRGYDPADEEVVGLDSAEEALGAQKVYNKAEWLVPVVNNYRIVARSSPQVSASRVPRQSPAVSVSSSHQGAGKGARSPLSDMSPAPSDDSAGRKLKKRKGDDLVPEPSKVHAVENKNEYHTRKRDVTPRSPEKHGEHLVFAIPAPSSISPISKAAAAPAKKGNPPISSMGKAKVVKSGGKDESMIKANATKQGGNDESMIKANTAKQGGKDESRIKAARQGGKVESSIKETKQVGKDESLIEANTVKRGGKEESMTKAKAAKQGGKDESMTKANAAKQRGKDESMTKANAAKQIRKDESMIKVNVVKQGGKDESMTKANATKQGGKDGSMIKAKAAKQEGKDKSMTKAKSSKLGEKGESMSKGKQINSGERGESLSKGKASMVVRNDESVRKGKAINVGANGESVPKGKASMVGGNDESVRKGKAINVGANGESVPKGKAVNVGGNGEAVTKGKAINVGGNSNSMSKGKAIPPKVKGGSPRVPIFSMAPVGSNGQTGNKEGGSGLKKRKQENMTSAEGPRPKIPKPNYTSIEKEKPSKLQERPDAGVEFVATASTPALEQKARGSIFKPRIEDWDISNLVPAILNNRVLLLENLVPGLHSDDLSEALTQELKCRCDVLIIPPKSPYFNTTSALLKLQSSNLASKVHEAMNSKCLAIMGRLVTTSRFKYSDFKPSQLAKSVGRIEFQNERRNYTNENYRDAMATSHLAQGNTIEFDFGLAWRVLDEQQQEQWRMLQEEFKPVKFTASYKAT